MRFGGPVRNFILRGTIMPKKISTCLSAFLILVMLAFAYGEANAARIGGGRSFGGRPSMSQPFTKPTPPVGSQSMRQQASSRQQAATAATPNRGLFGGMGGMLGGLLAGSLLGSLLFGGGFSGGGFLDIIIIAALLFFGFKFFGRRRAASQTAATQAAGHAPSFDMPGQQPAADSVHQRSSEQRGGFDWSALSTPAAGSSQPAYQEAARVPAGFDEEEFLRGAKAAYTRLNASWDKRDLNDIAQFSTPAFLAELRKQAEEDKTPGTTEIMLVNASIVEVNTVGNEEIAQVYFDVLLREDPSQESPAEVREVWHFVRPAGGQGTWKLDGIQQVENM